MAEITGKDIWNDAAVAGLAIGAFTVVMQLLAGLAAKISGGVAVAMLGSVVKFLVWAVKFVGCIWLMRFFMLRLCRRFNGVTNYDTRRFGMHAALLSAFIVSAFVFCTLYFTSPEELLATVEAAVSAAPVQMDSNTRAALDRMIGKLPAIYFFVNLFYCWLYGTVLSAILSRNIPPFNPFDNIAPDE